MKLGRLAEGVCGARIVGDPDVDIRQVSDDSRTVTGGTLFVAIPGRRFDGAAFVEKAIENGAVAVVVREAGDYPVPQLVVDSPSAALGILSSRIHGDPAEQLCMIAITGTNGKTTTAHLVESILAAANQVPAVIGTVSYRYGGKDYPAPYTTPIPTVLHCVLSEMLRAGSTHVVLETSSSALAMDRLSGVEVSVAAFTNLSQDHLEVHGSMDAYRDAKKRLFSHYLPPGGIAVINMDDPASMEMLAAVGSRKTIRVSARDAEADVYVMSSDLSIHGVALRCRTPRGVVELESSSLLGGYNVSNIAVAVAIGEALQIELEAIKAGVRDLANVPGRVERVHNDRNLNIFVDYAHTPDALSNVLSAIRPFTKGRLICVFGCGGDRDPTKRAPMGAAVATHADLPIVTSDNPRTENPQQIIDMILPAIPTPHFVDKDRRVAICAAIDEATPNDVVVIAGKGHENYQVIGEEKHHFDDREQAVLAVQKKRRFWVSQVIKATGGQVLGSPVDLAEFSRITIDGRTAAPGDLYIAIPGQNFDGHDFCAQAVQRGASGVLIDEAKRDRCKNLEATIIAVPDPRLALGELSREVRREWGKKSATKLVAVTGSSGKTTTKNLIAAALGQVARVYASPGSWNNETGVPLTLLGLRDYHSFAVLEMGMRSVGQIDYLCCLAEPDVGVVVNAGTAHVGEIGSVERIAQGKAEIYGRLGVDGVAVVPAWDHRLLRYAAKVPRMITFGMEPQADVRLVHYQWTGSRTSEITFLYGEKSYTTQIPLFGKHNAMNATCAMAVAVAVGVCPQTAAQGLAHTQTAPMRGETIIRLGRHILVDCYNANPASMEAALDGLEEVRKSAGSVAVVGDMLELGKDAEQFHYAVGRHAAEKGVFVIALGQYRDTVVLGVEESGGGGIAVADPTAAADALLAHSRSGDWVLLKASRGMRLERVLKALERTS